jgi:hypothetical protein
MSSIHTYLPPLPHKALPNTLSASDTELIYAKILDFGTLIDDTLEQSQSQRETYRSFDGKLPPGAMYISTIVLEWFEGLKAKSEDLEEAWRKRAPVSFSSLSRGLLFLCY